jgi:hypothetical protein
MQQGYTYTLSEPMGKNFHPDFKPELTPKEMLSLGVFGGKYMTDCKGEFPKDWFIDAKLCHESHDPNLNFFGVNASQPLSVWVKNGWIYPLDPRGWFQWYCRYYMGRRIPEEDMGTNEKEEMNCCSTDKKIIETPIAKLSNTSIVSTTKNSIFISVPNGFIKEWLELPENLQPTLHIPRDKYLMENLRSLLFQEKKIKDKIFVGVGLKNSEEDLQFFKQAGFDFLDTLHKVPTNFFVLNEGQPKTLF